MVIKIIKFKVKHIIMVINIIQIIMVIDIIQIIMVIDIAQIVIIKVIDIKHIKFLIVNIEGKRLDFIRHILEVFRLIQKVFRHILQVFRW